MRYGTPFVLGCIMTEMMLISGNMAYTSILHFVNNLTAVLVSSLPLSGVLNESAAAMPHVTLSMVGVYLIFFGTPAPVLLYTGFYLLKRAESPQIPSFLEMGKETQSILKIFLPAIIILLGGMLCLFAGGFRIAG